MLQHKSRQLYFHLLIHYLYLQQKLLFPSAQVSAIVLSISTSSKSSHITKVTVVETRAPDEIVTRSPIEKGEKPFQPVTTTVFPSAKLPASLS